MEYEIKFFVFQLRVTKNFFLSSFLEENKR
jgi:hypothetical protein